MLKDELGLLVVLGNHGLQSKQDRRGLDSRGGGVLPPPRKSDTMIA